MSSPVFMLDTFAMPLLGGIIFNQSYEPIGGASVLRTLNGTGIKQAHWRKLRTIITAQGWVPDGLQALDYDLPLLMKCIRPEAVYSTSNSMTLPEARRSDAGHTPTGAALVGAHWVESPVSISTNTATVTTVTGATAYMVEYYPEFTVICEPPRRSFDRARAEYSWSLEAEEV